MAKKVEETDPIRCPECHNAMRVKYYDTNTYRGICPVCKSVVHSQRHTKERLIRVFYGATT